MRRALMLLAGAIVVVAAIKLSDHGRPGPRYTVEMDTASGLTVGSDVKVDGIRAGVIDAIRLDARSYRALVRIQIEDPAAGRFHVDARCESRPQSLIGEYFMDCEPGHAPDRLRDGATLPVSHTASTIAADVVTNVLRRPYAERLRLIVSSLGAGVAGNGERLNAALRRAVPAIRETDAVLHLVADQRHQLSDLTRDANTVLGALADRRKDVGRFIDSADKLAGAAAQRREDLAGALRDTPGFLAQLTPTMDALGDLAHRGTPALADLRATSPELERALRLVPPLAGAVGPAVQELGRTADTGRPIIPAARAQVDRLTDVAARLPETLRDGAITLEHLDNRGFSVEDDPRSPGGKGWTGFEGILRYVVYQGTALNAFDAETHLLNTAAFPSPRCGMYHDVADVKADASLEDECSSRLGASQPGITSPDPTLPAASRHAKSGRRRRSHPDRGRPPASLVPDQPGAPAGSPTASPSQPGQVGGVIDTLVDAIHGALPPGQQAQGDDLLDFLLGP